MIALWLALSAANADDLCGEDPVSEVEAAMEDLLAKYRALDEAGFDRSSKQLDAKVSCLDRVAPGATVARLHQTMAMVAFVNGQKVASGRAMTAARLSDPRWTLSLGDFPNGHPLRGIYDGANDPGPVEAIGSIAPKAWVVDGIERVEAPTERAFLLQVLNGDGTVLSSEYLYNLEDLPDHGQDATVSSWETPFLVSLSGRGGLRFLSATQRADGPGIRPTDSAAVGGGGSLAVRFTPISFVGAEVELASLGGADPVLGRTFGAELTAVGLFGGGSYLGEQQIYGAFRLGFARDTLISWVAGPNGAEQLLSPVNAFVGGVEAGARSPSFDVRVAVDAIPLAGDGLFELRPGGYGTIAITGPLAVNLGLSGRTGGLDLLGADDSVIGTRRDVELRFVAGPSLVFDG